MESPGKPAVDLARELGVRRNQLYKWKEQLDRRGTQAFRGAGTRPEISEEVGRLKREVEKGKEERDILKGGSVLCQGARVKYAFMRAHDDQV